MSYEIMLSVENVSRRYGSICAVNNISFNADRGGVTGFLGPNGAGKSTLMQIICGVLAASSGKVTIKDYDILEHPLEARRQLGYLPEHPPLYPDCTIDEYLDFCARLRGISKKNISSALNESKEKCNLEDMGKRLIGNLSKGYRQRVGLAQAIIHKPDLLVLDEPASGLDPNQMLEIRKLIRNIGNHHCVILSTHLLQEARDICDRILILNKGDLVLDKPMTELVKDSDTLEQIYLQLTNAGNEQVHHA